MTTERRPGDQAEPAAPSGAHAHDEQAGDQVHGYCDPAFARVGEVFADSFARGDELGGAVTLYAGDRAVVDLWCGVADRRTGRPWLHDTPCLTFSCAKAVTASAALLLWERTAYGMDRTVTEWWPEFGGDGKEETTAAHLLGHQAGLPVLERPVTVEEALDPAAVAALLAAQEPQWRPGEDHGYHALTYGWLAGEIVRRLGGGTGAYVDREIAGPSGLDLWLGAPDHVIARVARVSTGRPRDSGDARGDRAVDSTAEGAEGSAAGSPSGSGASSGTAAALEAATRDPDSLMNRSFGNPPAAAIPGGQNHPMLLAAGWPASGLVTTANGLAGFYRDLVAGRILRPETLDLATRARASGPDRVCVIDSAFGLGFMLPSTIFPVPRAARDTAFGHTGLSGSIGLGDRERGLAMAYVTNRMGASTDMRAYRLLTAAYAAMG